MRYPSARRLTASKKVQLIWEVSDFVRSQVESLENEHVGADLCYLQIAIVSDSYCEWPPWRRIIQLLRKLTHPPRLKLGSAVWQSGIDAIDRGQSRRAKHPVWRYIKVSKES